MVNYIWFLFKLCIYFNVLVYWQLVLNIWFCCLHLKGYYLKTQHNYSFNLPLGVIDLVQLGSRTYMCTLANQTGYIKIIILKLIIIIAIIKFINVIGVIDLVQLGSRTYMCTLANQTGYIQIMDVSQLKPDSSRAPLSIKAHQSQVWNCL